MKAKLKYVAILATLVGAIAYAGDYLTYQTTLVNQTTGSAGVISAAPSGATAGISIKSTKSFIGNPIANVCRVTLEQPSGYTFQDDKLAVNGQQLRGWRYSGTDPLGGTPGWSRAPWLDLSVTNAIDGGTGTNSSMTACKSAATCGITTLTFPLVTLMPPAAMGETAVLDTSAARYFWSAENVEEDGGTGLSLDGGLGELIECFTQ
jgi:hypothetical protein